jgi:putative CocE/NonD family hydrolase
MIRIKRIFQYFLSILLVLSFFSFNSGKTEKGSNYIAKNYDKHEYYISMRDGVKLFTVVYSPKDRSVKYPIMLTRTPYSVGPYGGDKFKEALGPSELFEKEGYIFVYQDVRGRFMSEGTFDDMRPYISDKKNNKDIDESSDTYDTIDWLVKNIENNNGKVAMWGISYPGFYTAMGIIDAHPALVAASPQAPIADWFVDDDFHRNGAFWLPHAFNFYSAFGIPRPEPIKEWPRPVFTIPTPDGYNFFLKMGPFKNTDKEFYKGRIPLWNQFLDHPDYDEYWQARNTLPHFKHIKPAVMTVGGWFDAEDLYGALHTYASIEDKNPGIINTIVMGPWFHGGWARSEGDHLGNIWFGSNTSEFYEQNIELKFFNYYLKGKRDAKLPEAYVFETGTNQWKTYDKWPPENVKRENLYFYMNGKLSFEKPASHNSDFDEYISDPNKPVPFTASITNEMPREYMDEDQRFASTRPDVLVYQTDELGKNVTIAGPMIADLFVSTSGTDADWVVKVIDVYPDTASDNKSNPPDIKMGGFEMMVRGDIMRGKYRNSYEKPEPFIPNKVTEVKLPLQDINHTFLKGHRIMIQIQSSWFPLADRNPQKFTNIYHAKESDFQKAIQRVYHAGSHPTHLEVNILND